MNHSLKIGFSFGLTSGVITTLGLIIGLGAGTHSKIAVIGGILTIAVADAFSDALGIHLAEESETVHQPKSIWQATFSTFVSKFIFALSFIIPVSLLELNKAMWVSIIWGLFLLALFSFQVAKREKIKASKVVGEHLLIALAVIIITYFLGLFINRSF